jgi:F-type H+-transporting ATPase subunit gamma
MAQSLQVLRRRVRSIDNTRQITRAMEMVSAAKLRQAQRALSETRPYARQLQRLLGRLAPTAEAEGHPFFAPRVAKRSTLLLFTADRGLCGSYNAGVIRRAESLLNDHPLGTLELVCVGRRGADYFSRRKWPVAARFVDTSNRLDPAKSDALSDFVCNRFLAGETSEVYLLYNAFVSTAVHRLTYEKFLDLDQSSLLKGVAPEERHPIDYIFEPDRRRVFDRLVPAYLHSKIFITMAEALGSEHSARMLAMNNATKNCDELVDSLTLSLNKARQSSITRDLIDIVGGAEAQKK